MLFNSIVRPQHNKGVGQICNSNMWVVEGNFFYKYPGITLLYKMKNMFEEKNTQFFLEEK